MKIINQTADDVVYEISGTPGGYNCGSIEPNSTSPDLSTYNNNQNVQVKVAGAPQARPANPLTINIPNTGEGKAVTIALSFE